MAAQAGGNLWDKDPIKCKMRHFQAVGQQETCPPHPLGSTLSAPSPHLRDHPQDRALAPCSLAPTQTVIAIRDETLAAYSPLRLFPEHAPAHSRHYSLGGRHLSCHRNVVRSVPQDLQLQVSWQSLHVVLAHKLRRTASGAASRQSIVLIPREMV